MSIQKQANNLQHLGTMRNSSEKRNASFLRRSRIMRGVHSTNRQNFVQYLVPVCSLLLSSTPLGLVRSLGNICAGPLLQQDRSRCHHSRYKPPQRNTRLPDDFGCKPSSVPAHSNPAPNEGCTCKTQQPGNSGDRPEQDAPPDCARANLPRASAPRNCVPRRKISRKLNVHAAERVKRLRSLRLHRGTQFACGKMRGRATTALRWKFLRRAVVQSIASHECEDFRSLPHLHWRRPQGQPMRHARLQARDRAVTFTVEIGVLKTTEISSSCISS